MEDKILGSLVGGAIGDALGYPVEFMGYESILRQFGPEGVTGFLTNSYGVAEISDDTQMTLFTANGILNAIEAVGTADLSGCVEEFVGEAYKEWLFTQTYKYRSGGTHSCWIMDLPELYSRRAPGNTCLSALRLRKIGEVPDNGSKGCGGIMRVAPVALLGPGSRRSPAANCQMACAIAKHTHTHPLGYLPAGMMAFALSKVVEAEDADRALLIAATREAGGCLASIYGESRDLKELREGSEEAISLASADIPDIDAIKRLGEGWTGEEAWYIALFCTLRHIDNFRAALTASVTHSGDSDSTGAITGNLIGAIHGYSAIPECLKENLELREAIERMGKGLYEGHM